MYPTLIEKYIMLWIIIIGLIFLLLIYLLFARLSINIDTGTNRYYIDLNRVFKLYLEYDELEVVKLRLRIFYSNFNFYPLKRSKKKKKKKRKSSLTRKQALQLIKSFKVRDISLDLDTGNCITNAKLFPVFAFLNYRLGDFHINFEGRNRLVLLIENRPIRIIKSFINF
jgi:hypothetical protein